MKAREMYSASAFIEKYAPLSPIDAKTVTLRAGAKISIEKEIVKISEYSLDSNRCSDFLKALYPALRVPKDMPVELTTPIIEYQLEKCSEYEVSVRDEKITNFQPNKFPFKLAELCENIMNVTKSSDISKMSSVSQDEVTIYSVDKKISGKPKVNDIICGGLALRAHINGKLSVHPFSLRLSCSNA